MSIWFSPQARLFALITLCAFLWSLESIIPLYKYDHSRLRRVLPNLALTVALIVTNLALSFSSAYIANFSVRHGVGLFALIRPPSWIVVVIGVAAMDLFIYLAHVSLHKSWLGWQFHRVHHTENLVDVTTTFRQHPGETFWRILWQLTAILVFGLPLWVVIVYLTISSLNGELEHANVRLGSKIDWLIRLVIVTPNMHKAHHSRVQSETDSNYSNIFSVWDRIFGTYTRTVDFTTLRYGLDGFDDRDKQSLRGLLKMPFAT